MIRYPTHLHFDSSASSRARFFGASTAVVSIHWAKGKGVAQQLLACPESIGITGKKCLFCSAQAPSLTNERSVALAWDLGKAKWCICLLPAQVAAEIREANFALGVSDEDFSAGLGVDIILQRTGSGLEIMPIPESKGQPRGKGKVPDIRDFLGGMENRSVWVSYSSPYEVPERV